MSLFRKFFGSSGNEAASEDEKISEFKSPYTPDLSLPIDEQFTLQFQKNGGKFIVL